MRLITMTVLITMLSIQYSLAASAYGNIRAELSEVSRAELIDIFTGEQKYWPDGNKIEVLVQERHSREQGHFVRTKLGMSVSRFFRMYNKNKHGTFRKTSYESNKNLIKYMKKHRGTVGLINNSLYYYDTKRDSIVKLIILNKYDK